ncbi:MAG TPA: TonB family protein [Dokdonella sp.]|nr:TonB family protein [Dokdonella sp.]
MVIGASLPRRRTPPRPESRTDWRAVIVAVAAHVALLLALLASPYVKPLRRDLPQMILVELASSDLASSNQHAVAQARAPTPARSPVAASAAPRRERAPVPTRAARVVADGREVAVASGSAGERIAATTAAATAAPLAGAAAGADGDGEGRVRGARFRPPRVLKRVLPSYPDDAYAQGRQGSVDVIVTVGVDGAPLDAHVYSASGSPSLDRAAVDAVRAWSYAAATKDGEPTQAQAIVTIDWSIARETRLRAASRASSSHGNVAGTRGCLIRDAQHADLCR